MITPYLRKLLDMLEFDTAGEPHPYLFSPESDVSRPMTSSQWSQFAKGVVKRWTGIAAPPKTMRASFITYMKVRRRTCAHDLRPSLTRTRIEC